MRRALAAALAVLAAASVASVPRPAGAQTVRLYLQRVAQRPAEILLVPGFLTILEFEEAVSAVATGNPGVVELVDVTGGTVMLRPRTGSGVTDIVVAVGEVRAMFRARVASQPRTTHKYVVVSSAPPEDAAGEERSRDKSARRPATQVAARVPAPQPSPAAPSAPAPQQGRPGSEWDQFVQGLNRQQKELLLALMRDLSVSRLFEFLGSLTPLQRETFLRLARLRGLQGQGEPAGPAQQPARAPAQQPPQAGSGPEWIDWQVTVQRTPSGTVLQYTLTNTGQRTVLADILRLRVTAGGAQARFVLARTNPSGYAGRIEPGQAEAGTIALQGDPGGPVTLEWRLVEVGSGTVYTLIRTVQ